MISSWSVIINGIYVMYNPCDQVQLIFISVRVSCSNVIDDSTQFTTAVWVTTHNYPGHRFQLQSIKSQIWYWSVYIVHSLSCIGSGTWMQETFGPFALSRILVCDLSLNLNHNFTLYCTIGHITLIFLRFTITILGHYIICTILL